MKHTYLVVDINFLHSQALRDRLCSQPDIRLVLPDLAMFEMSKSSNREFTFKRSLGIMAQEPNRVFVSRALGDCLSYELNRKVAVVGHLVDREATVFVRRLLSAVATGIRNAEYDQVIEDPQNQLLGMVHDYLNHTTNKTRLAELVDATKLLMTTEFSKRLRSASVTRQEKLDFIYEKAPSLLVDMLKENGFSREKAICLLRQKPMILRYCYLKLWECLLSEQKGRLKNRREKDISNDLIDHEYVLTATFFNGVLSHDGAVNDAYAAVSQILSRV